MRKAMVVLALIAASAFFVGAMPTPAGAANCTYVNAGASSNGAGYIHYGAQVTNCTGITAIKYVWYDPAFSGTTSGWYDVTGGSWANGMLNCGGGPAYADCTVNTTFGATITVTAPCWYVGATRSVSGYFMYRIKNAAAPYNWGPTHDKLASVPSSVPC